MHKFLTFSITVILLISLIFSVTGCSGSNNEIKDLMATFEQACNTLDFNGVLDCINPKISEKVKLAVGLVGVFADTDTDEMFESLAGYLSKDQVGGTDFFSSIKIDVTDINVKGESAEVSTVLTYKINDTEMTNNTTFNCVYYNDKWYISSFLFN